MPNIVSGQPGPLVQLDDGTFAQKTFDVGAGGGGGSSSVQYQDLVTSPVTVSAANNSLFPATDISAYQYVKLVISGTYTGVTYAFQGSDTNNGTDWINVSCARTLGSSQTYASNSANFTWYIQMPYKYLRVQVTTLTTGSISAYAELSTRPLDATLFPYPSTPVTISAPLRLTKVLTTGTIATGGTSQTMVAAAGSRNFLEICNTSSGNLYINYGATPASTYTKIILPGQTWEEGDLSVSSQQINIFGATTGQTYYYITA